MAEKKHVEMALRACAEQGVPDVTVPWTDIRERALDERGRSFHRGRFLPRTRAGWVFAAALIALLSMGAYAAGGLLYTTFQQELPGGEAMNLGQKLDQSQNANGIRVSLEWAYADQSSVVLGYSIEDLREDRRVAGYPTRLEPAFAYERPDGSKVSRGEVLTDETGARLRAAEGGQYAGSDEEVPVVSVYKASEGMEPGERVRLRAAIPIAARVMPPQETSMQTNILKAPGMPGEGIPSQKQVGAPFVFDFEVPVRAAPTVRVDQAAKAGGVTIFLDRVIDSPGRPEAVFCFDPPDDEHDWYISDFVGGSASVEDRENCQAVLLRSGLERRSSVTVTQIEGIPRPGTFRNDEEFNEDMRTIRGPWTFEFEVPER